MRWQEFQEADKARRKYSELYSESWNIQEFAGSQMG